MRIHGSISMNKVFLDFGYTTINMIFEQFFEKHIYYSRALGYHDVTDSIYNVIKKAYTNAEYDRHMGNLNEDAHEFFMIDTYLSVQSYRS